MEQNPEGKEEHFEVHWGGLHPRVKKVNFFSALTIDLPYASHSRSEVRRLGQETRTFFLATTISIYDNAPYRLSSRVCLPETPFCLGGVSGWTVGLPRRVGRVGTDAV